MFDIEQARENLERALLTTVGEDYAERRSMEMLMPEIFELRNNGFSLEQIMPLLRHNGSKLQITAMRTYYNEMLANYIFNLTLQMDEQFKLIIGHALDKDKAFAKSAPPDGKTACLSCLLLQPGVESIARKKDVPEEVYTDGQMEHPAVPGLLLSKDERLYGAHLEIIDGKGGVRFETAFEKRFRLKWQKPIPRTVSSTDGNFIEINPELFGGN